MSPSTNGINGHVNGHTNGHVVELQLGDFCIDEYKPLKVIVIGAGFSGIAAGIRFRQHISNLDLTIYDKNDSVGGTWYVNRYPGIACDVPAHCFQFSFDQKNDWSALYSPGKEILSYLRSVVDRYQLEPYIKLSNKMTRAWYNEPTGKWHVLVTRPSVTSPGEFEEFEDTCDFLFTGMGILSRWSWPDIDGLKNFKGTLVHSANWDLGGATWEDDAKDWHDKNVAVIGLGSTALQIVAALQPKVGKLYNFGRGKAWISPPFAVTKFSELLSRDVFSDENYVFSEEEKKRLDDPVFGRQFRHALEQDMNSLHTVTMHNSPLQQQVQVWFKAHMIHRLAKKPEIAEKLIPDFSVTCRRLTPAPGYLDALCQENVELITSDIKHVTSDTVETKDGSQTKLDVIICATGFDSSYRYPFPIIGRDGVDLCDKWTPTAKTYLSVCVDGFPNCFFGLGPNSTIGTGSLIPMIEHQVDYAVQVAMKLQRERLKSIEVKKRAVEDFDRFIEGYFPKTVFTEKVRTWYKLGKDEGRVVGLWPGSTLHALKALKYPRWEDFNYEHNDGESSHNSLYWLGNGMTNNEKTLTGDRAWYLSKEYMDVPPIPTATIKNKV